MLLRILWLVLIYLAIVECSILQTRQMEAIFESSSSGSGIPAKESLITTATQTILHEISGTNTAGADVATTGPATVQTDTRDPDCVRRGVCGITTSPSPTQVMNIDLEIDTVQETSVPDQESSLFSDENNGEEEPEREYTNTQSASESADEDDYKHIVRILQRLENNNQNKAVEETLRNSKIEQKLSKLESVTSNMAVMLGNLVHNFAQVQSDDSEQKVTKNLVEGVQTLLNKFNSGDFAAAPKSATEATRNLWMTATTSPTADQEAKIAYSVDELVKERFEESSARNEKSLKTFREELLKQMKETMENCGQCNKEGNTVKTSGDTDPTKSSSSSEVEPQTVGTAASDEPAPPPERDDYPKVMMCKSCCEEVPLSEFLASQKRQRQLEYTDSSFDYSEAREADTYDIVSTATLQKDGKWESDATDEFDIDFDDGSQNTHSVNESAIENQEAPTSAAIQNQEAQTSASPTESPTTSSPDKATTSQVGTSTAPSPTTTVGVVPTETAFTHKLGVTSNSQNDEQMQTKLITTNPYVTEVSMAKTASQRSLENRDILEHRLDSEEEKKSKENINLPEMAMQSFINTSYTFISKLYQSVTLHHNDSKLEDTPISHEEHVSTIALPTVGSRTTDSASSTLPGVTTPSFTTAYPSTIAVIPTLGTPKPSKHEYALHCADLFYAGERRSGVYRISPLGKWSWKVYCDMETDGGGWTIIQRRMFGNVNFTRGWEDYKRGFGYITGDHWIGLDRMHTLTSSAKERSKMTLRIDLRDWHDVTRFAEYDTFRVGNEAKKYKLLLKNYQGNAGNAMQYGKNFNHNHQGFTTFDRDNDGYLKGNCGDYYRSGWWFNACFAANLNGKYYEGKYTGIQNGIYWGTWYQLNDERDNSRYSFNYVDMKIRPTNFVATLRQRSNT